MRFPRFGEDEGASLQIAPMVDIVFILLSFFVMASTFRLDERDVAAAYASAESRREMIGRGDLPAEVPIVLARQGGGVSIRVGHATLADDDYAAITSKLAEINIPQMAVRLVVDPSLTIDQVTRAMDAVLRSPMRQLSLAELAPDAGGAKEATSP